MPMASTLSATRDDPLLDGGVAPAVEKDRYASVEEALTRLAHQGASDTPDARPREPASVGAADARVSQSFAAGALGPADLSAQLPREQRSSGMRGTLARVAIVACLGVCAIWAWRSYGGLATAMVATWAPRLSAQPSAEQTPVPPTPAAASQQAAAPATSAPAQAAAPAASQAAAQAASQAAAPAASIAPPATTVASEPPAAAAGRQQIETMARDLAALRQTVDRLAAGQEQLIHEMTKLQATKPPADKPAEKRTPRRASPPTHGSDAFDPTQSPTAPGVPRPLGAIVVPR